MAVGGSGEASEVFHGCHPVEWGQLNAVLDAFHEGRAPALGVLVAGETERSAAGRMAASAAALALERHPRLRVVQVPLAGTAKGGDLKLEQLALQAARHPNLQVLALVDGLDSKTLDRFSAQMGNRGAGFGRSWPPNLGVLCSSTVAAHALLSSPGAEAMEVIVLGVLDEEAFQRAAEFFAGGASVDEVLSMAEGDGTARWWLREGAVSVAPGEKITLGFATGGSKDPTPPAVAWAKARGLAMDLGSAQAYATHLRRYSRGGFPAEPPLPPSSE